MFHLYVMIVHDRIMKKTSHIIIMSRDFLIQDQLNILVIFEGGAAVFLRSNF